MYLDKSLPTEVRYLAIIQLKNGIDKYWRKTTANTIAKEEKVAIRSRLLEGGIGEADMNLALQNALVISKVVRIDYPQDWPDALADLIKTLRTANESNQLHLRRALLILLQVVKELATARMRQSQTSLKSVTPEIVFLLNEIYVSKVAKWLGFFKGSGDDEGGAMDAMENSLFTFKIIRRLLVVGYDYPNHDKAVQDMWGIYQDQFGTFVDTISQDPPILGSPAKELVEQHAIQYSKLHVQMAQVHPAAFILLPNTLPLVRAYWRLISKFGESYGSKSQDFSAKALENDDKTKNDRPAMEKLSLKGLTILRACMKMAFIPAQSFKYRTPEVKAEQQLAVTSIKTELFIDDLVSEIASVIVTKFFVFRQIDLEAWEEDEDEWEIREEGGGDTWEFELRPCAEKLFMDLVINFKHLLVQPLLGFFMSVAGADQGNVVTKDAVYTAMGLSAAVVHESFDFDAFLTSTLVNDVQQTGPGYKVLRRRIAILIGQWITIKVSEANRPLVYQIFQHMLKKEDETNDYVVRVTAARQFRYVVDDFTFNTEGFLPYAPDILGRIMALIQEVENTETKLAVLETIRALAVRLDTHISPFADQIVSILPGLWEDSGEEHLLKQAILSILSTLVSSMREQSQRYHSLILPLIQRAVAPDSEMQIYLLEEALDLWSTILAQTPSPAPPDVLALTESAFPLLEIGSDNLRVVLNIVESYILLAPEAMLGDAVRLKIVSYMASILGVSKRDLAGQVTTIVENMILAAQALGNSDGVALIAKDLHESGYAEKILEGLHDAWEANQTIGPSRKYPKVDDVVRTDYFTILARIAFGSPTVFVSMLSAVGNVNDVWVWLSSEWFRHFDSMANIDRQKLSCLALTRLLEQELPITPQLLEKLQDYFSMWTMVIGEMISGQEDGGDNLVWEPTEGNEYEGPEEVRRRLHSDRDPVHTVHTFQFVQQRLGALVNMVGGQEEFQKNWLVNVDKDILDGYQHLGAQREID